MMSCGRRQHNQLTVVHVFVPNRHLRHRLRFHGQIFPFQWPRKPFSAANQAVASGSPQGAMWPAHQPRGCYPDWECRFLPLTSAFAIGANSKDFGRWTVWPAWRAFWRWLIYSWPISCQVWWGRPRTAQRRCLSLGRGEGWGLCSAWVNFSLAFAISVTF